MIRRFDKNDINAVMQLWINENIRAHSFISKNYWIDHYRYVKEVLPKAEIYVYVIDDKVAGFIGLNHDHIEGIFVDSKVQGHGIGRALLNKVKENRTHLTLSVYKKNKHAIEFYKKKGFVILSENKEDQTKEIEYLMSWYEDLEEDKN